MRAYGDVLVSEGDGRERSVLSLARIDGIGRKSAEALYDHGIRQCADLATYTEEEFTHALKEQGIDYPSHMLKRWNVMGQARDFAQQDNAKVTRHDETTDQAEASHTIPDDPPDRLREFQFTVTVRQRTDDLRQHHATLAVYDEWETGEEQLFEANETAEWASWILNQVRLHLGMEHISIEFGLDAEPSPTEEKVGVSPMPIASCDAGIRILDVEATEAEPYKRLEAKIHLQVSEPALNATWVAPIPYWLQLYAVDQESGASSIVTFEQGQLMREELSSTKTLEFPIPEPGRYELRCLAFFLPPIEKATLCGGPRFSVVP